MRLLKTGFKSAYVNMAMDESVFRQLLVVPTLRLYQWSRPAFSFGYFQKINEIIEISACQKRKIELVRRITGGGTVIHSRDVTFSLTIPKGWGYLPDGISSAHQAISEYIVNGLNKIGVEAYCSKISAISKKLNICLINPVKYDVMINGKKVMGIAQRRSKNATLYQGYLALDSPSEIIQPLISREPKVARLLANNSTELNSQLTHSLSRNQVEKAILIGLKDGIGQDMIPSELSTNETKSAFELEKKYRSNQWNFRDY